MFMSSCLTRVLILNTQAEKTATEEAALNFNTQGNAHFEYTEEASLILNT